MATIKTAIALYDGVTSPLQSMHKAMNIVLNSFEAMQRASRNSVDVSAIREARDELARAGAAFDSIEQNIRDAGNQQDKFNRKIKDGTSAADGLLGKMKGVAATVGGLAAVKKLLNISDQFSNTNARLNNAMVQFDDDGSLTDLEKQVMASAQRSRTFYMDAASSVAKLGLNARDAFGGMDEVIAFQELINKQFVVGGASVQEQQAAMIQLTQAMSSGVLRGEELNSVFEQAPGIVQNIADYLDVPIGTIREMAAEGQITTDIVKNAMFAAANDIEEKFNNMPKTWGQIWTSMKNMALSVFNPILTKLNQIANSEKFKQVTDGIINGLAGIAAVATMVLDVLISIASAIVDNWSWISPIVWGVTTAFLAYQVATKGAAIATGIVIAAKALAVPIYALLTGATMAETAAQWGLNAAMYSCPLVWIIMLIIAVIAVIYAACAAIAKFTGVADSGFGVICGGINVVIQFFKNLGLSVANIALGIWDALGACASNIGTAFHNAIANVQGWFYNLLSTALTVVAGICEALNKLPFVEFDYSGITAKADEYAAKSAEAYGSVEEYKSVSDAFNAGMSTFDTFQDGWVADAFEAGVTWGDGVADKVSGLFDFSASDSLGAFDLGNDLNDIYTNTGNIAANTAATADALDIAEEDLAYLRDIAEREAINRFTTAEVKVEQTNTNYISKDTDLDGIVDAWANDFAQRLDVSAEGVHA